MRCLLVFLCSIFTTALSQAQEPGENWTQVRGVNSPQAVYSAFVESPNGTLIAGGSGARLMLSSDGGKTWRYDVIKDDSDRPLVGTITDLIVSNNNVVGSLVRFVPSENRFGQPFEAQTLLIFSGDNGTNWDHQVFPRRSAFLNGLEYPGVYLPKLFKAANGELLAYGSTGVANAGIAWLIGGAIFRQTGADWEQAYFEGGIMRSMTESGGRLAASGLQRVLDSADGRGWNGYSTAAGNFNVDGQPLDALTKGALIGSDLVFKDGQFVMQAQQYKRLGVNRFLAAFEANYIFASPNPFDGGRIWNGASQPRVYPNWRRAGDRLVSVGFGGAYTSSTGLDWSLADADVRAGFGAVGPVNSQSVVAVGDSDNAWRSDNAGLSWQQLLSVDISRDILSQPVRIGNRLLARVGNTRLWTSDDNGRTWVEGADIRAQTGTSALTRLRVDGQRLWGAQGNTPQLIRSEDFGDTWQVVPIPTPNDRVVADVVIGQGGRLIIAPESKSVSAQSDFYTSDDDGQSWQPRPVEMAFGDQPKSGLYVGDGRVIFTYNQFASFGPELFISDDNGATWRRENPFENLDGLGTVSGDPTTKVLEIQNLFQTESGRLVIVGDDGEIVVSDDLGSTWRVVFNDDDERDDDVFLDWNFTDIAESDGSLMLAGTRRSGPFPYDNLRFVFLSRDDGDTWREIPLQTDQFGFNLVTNADGSVVLTGSNGSVFISDNLRGEPSDQSTQVRGREGDLIEVEVPRPPLAGEIDLSLIVTPLGAGLDTDFLAPDGELSWSEDDNASKLLTIETVDDDVREPTEKLQLDFFSTGELAVNFTYEVLIDDDDGTGRPGINLIDAGSLTTSEAGVTDQFQVALHSEPTQEVLLALASDSPAEVAFQPPALTFNAANWNVAQQVVVTGLDDALRDRDRSARITLSPSSDDSSYGGLSAAIVYVVNLDDEVDEKMFQDSFE